MLGALQSYGPRLTTELWKDLEAAKAGDSGVLSLAAALARFDPQKPEWANQADKIAEGLVRVDTDSLGAGSKREAAHRFVTPRLSLIFRDKSRTVPERKLATRALAVYLKDDPAGLADLLLVAEPDQFVSLFPVAETRKDEVVPVLKAQPRREEHSFLERPRVRCLLDETRLSSEANHRIRSRPAR